MNKTSALLGLVTLAVAGSLFTGTVMADTSTTSVNAASPKLLDHVVASYWGSYSGPSLGTPSNLTTDGDHLGALTSGNYQNLDSTLTLGYKILGDNITLNANYRFITMPVSTADGDSHFLSHDSYVSLKDTKLIHVGNFNMWADLRVYVPILHTDSLTTGFRTTQISTYDVPSTRISLGVFTFERVNIVKSDASSQPNAQIGLSPFASYQLTKKLSATYWADFIQYDYHVNSAFANRIVDTTLGVNWDVTPNVSLNPGVNFYPTDLTLDKTTVGLIVSAKIL